MLKRYKYFGMSEDEAKAYDGRVKVVKDPYEMIDIQKYMGRKGEITVFDVSNLDPKQIDLVVASTIQQVFKSNPKEKNELDTLLVYDEVHRLLKKFGGSGEGFVQLERGAREFRKWGIGLLLISQVLSDFVGEVKANIGTEIQMGTRHEKDLNRVKTKYGEKSLKSLAKAPSGTGMVVNPKYNKGRPYFVSFRPLLHSPEALDKKELENYQKYFGEVEDLEHQIKKLKEEDVDVMDLNMEMKLVRNKVKSGQFRIADTYLESLKPKVKEKWEDLGKKPQHLKKKKLSKKEIMQGVEKAEKEREKAEKKEKKEKKKSKDNKKVDPKKEIKKIKKKVKKLKDSGKNVKKIESKLEDFESKFGSIKGKTGENSVKEGLKDIKEAIKSNS